MPFVKHEIVPDVIPVAPSNIAKVNYLSGGDYSIIYILRCCPFYYYLITTYIFIYSQHFPWKRLNPNTSERPTNR